MKNFGVVLLDDSIRKPICRLYFNIRQKHIGLIVDAEKHEEKVPIADIDDIYQYAGRLRLARRLE